MITVKVSCYACGDVDVNLAEVTLFIFDRSNRHYYDMHCPECDTILAFHAESAVRKLLREHAVRTYYVRLPLEATEEHNELPFTDDDVSNFLIDLYHDGPEIEVRQWEERARGDSNSQPSA